MVPAEVTPQKLLRLPEVISRTGLGKSSIYQAMKDGSFPSAVPISQRSRAWREADIDAWIFRVASFRCSEGSRQKTNLIQIKNNGN